jgi:hypothetical protein
VSTLEDVLYKASTQCFGSLLRSPALGQRHLDKGVYIDQILRWYASFHPSQFHFMTLEDFSQDPRRGMNSLLRFLQVEHDEGNKLNSLRQDLESGAEGGYNGFIDGLDFAKKRLERPNARMSDLSALGEADLPVLRNFYAPYNALLRALVPAYLQ